MNEIKYYLRQILLLLIMSIATNAYSQSESTATDEFEKAFDACVELRNAVENKDTIGIKLSAEKMTKAEIVNFSGLHANDEAIVSMKGHFVFDENFANQLADGEEVYSHSEDFTEALSQRAPKVDGTKKVEAKNYCVKKGKCAKLSFVAKGVINIAVVSEAGGRLTMRMHASNKKGLQTHYYDTDDVKLGRPYRRAILTLPNDIVNSVVLEVKNCTKRDMSFVVIKR